MQIQLNRNGTADVIYDASDPEGDRLTFRIPTGPSHGELWTYPSIANYYPTTNYTGLDSFTYTASDGQFESLPATVTITITDTNNPPKALAQAVTVRTNGSALIHLNGSDRDKDPITFAIGTPPEHGSLTAEGAAFRYAPEPDYLGEDSFTFTANDGRDTSEPAKVKITITDGNSSPSASSATYTVIPDGSFTLLLGGTDPENDPLQFRVTTEPIHGELTGEPPNLTYTPAPKFRGQDRFSFSVSDQKFESSPATVTLRVSTQNLPPVANGQHIETVTNSPVQFSLDAVDANNDKLQGIVMKGPAHGRIFGVGTNWTYIPKLDFRGFDFFTYRLWDGSAYSKDARVTIAVDSVIEPPQPLVFQKITILRDTGKVQVRMSVPMGAAFTIEKSDDLHNWKTIIPNATSSTTDYVFEVDYLPDAGEYFRARVLD